MFEKVFKGVDFSYFYEKGTDRFTLYWLKYDLYIVLKDEVALLDLFNNSNKNIIQKWAGEK